MIELHTATDDILNLISSLDSHLARNIVKFPQKSIKISGFSNFFLAKKVSSSTKIDVYFKV